MDYQNSQQIITNFILIFDDNTEKIAFDVDKNILSTNCEYFKQMLTNFREKNANTITMKVTNARATRDVIMSFYGIKNCRYQLEKIKCMDFLGLEIDLGYFEKNVVQGEDFELLLDVIDMIGYNKETIEILAKNIPEDYDLESLPRELLQEILEREVGLKIAYISCYDGEFKLWRCNRKSYHLEKTCKYQLESFSKLRFINDVEKLVWVKSNDHDEGNIDVYNVANDSYEPLLTDNNVCNYLPFTTGYIDFLMSPDKKLFAYYERYDYSLTIWNTELNTSIFISVDDRIVGVRFLQNVNQILVYRQNGTINIYNVHHAEMKEFLGHSVCVDKKCFSNDEVYKVISSLDDQKILLDKRDYLEILDAETHKSIYSIKTKYAKNVSFSTDSQKIAFNDDKSVYIHDANNGKELYRISLDMEYDSCLSVLFSPGNQKIVVSRTGHINIYNANNGELLVKIDHDNDSGSKKTYKMIYFILFWAFFN